MTEGTEGMPEDDPVGADIRTVRMAAYTIVAHIDEFGQFWGEDIDALDGALKALERPAHTTAQELSDLHESIVACRTLDDFNAVQKTVLAIRALPT